MSAWVSRERLKEAEERLPIVELTRRLSESRLSTFDLLVSELELQGFERLPLKVPIRKDIVKFAGTSAHEKGAITVLVAQGVGEGAGHKYGMLSLTVTAPLAQTVADVSQWLGAEPEYPARGAQFAVFENVAEWTPICLAEAAAWRQRPMGSLAHMSVGDTGFGVSIIRSVTKAI